MRRPASVVVATCGLLAGCGDGTGSGDPPQEEAWRIGAAPDTVELEQTDAHVVASIGDVLEWGGDLVIVDPREADVKVYDPGSGRLRRVIGRRGEGPGEFLGPDGAAELAGGGLVVKDAPSRRISFFDTDGRFERSWSIPIRSTGGIDVLSDGDLILPGWLASEGGVMSDSAVHRFSPDGRRRRSYLLHPPAAPFPGISVQAGRSVEIDGALVLSETTSNLVRVLDLRTGSVRTDTVGASFYRPVSWTLEPPATVDEGRAWLRDQMMAWHLRDLGSGVYAMGFEEPADSLDRRTVRWVLGTREGPVATSESTDARVGYISDGRLHSVRIRPDGGAELVVGGVPSGVLSAAAASSPVRSVSVEVH